MENIVENVVEAVQSNIVSEPKKYFGFTLKELGVGGAIAAIGGGVVETAHQLHKHRPVKRFVGCVKEFFEYRKKAKTEEVKTTETAEQKSE